MGANLAWPNMFVRLRCAGMVGLALAALSMPARAQVLYGSIVGTVTDSADLAVPGATVVITHTETNQSRSTITNETGGYLFPNVAAGTYQVDVSLPGFQPFSARGVLVRLNTTVRVNAKLAVETLEESVRVSANAALLQTDTAAVQSQLVRETLENVPVNGRSFQSLLVLSPGVAQPNYFQTGGINNPSRSMMFTVNGAPNNNTVVRIDGVSATNQWIQGLQAYTPAMEAIESVNMVTNSFDAEQGMAGGASVNVQIKSGTNTLQGSAFEYLTAAALRARNYFLPPDQDKIKDDKNVFGGTVGGPIKRNTLFYFASLESTVQRTVGGPYATQASGSATQFLSLPPAAIRAGDFSSTGSVIYDPLTGAPDGTGRVPFAFTNCPGLTSTSGPQFDACNFIPANRIDPVARNILSLLPLPTLPGNANNYFATPEYNSDFHKIDTKLTWNASNALSVNGRFSRMLLGRLSIILAAALWASSPLGAADPPEELDRGLVAMPAGETEVYLGWRLLGTDQANVGFNVYRSTAGAEAVKLNNRPVTASTNFVDRTAPLDRENAWWVRPVSQGEEQEPSEPVRLPANAPKNPYVSIKLEGPYTPNKIGIADLDGDGKLDFVIKQPGSSIDPGDSYWRRSDDTYKLEAYRHDGTFLWRKDLGWNIELGIWYSPMVVFDLDGDGKAEIALRTAPTDEDYRDAEGHVLRGPEYLSILDGMTGDEIAKVDWIARGNVSDWGDETGNRASRHMVGVAYLDGKTPSVVVHRGTYTTMRVDAYNLVGRRLQKVWSWNGDDEEPQIRGQGMHGMKVADVDDDGRDELVLGAVALDDSGTVLWNANLGHPDVVYVADVDPERPGLEVAYGVEVKRKENGICLVEARTGEIIWGLKEPTTHIHDQGMLGDLDPEHPGMELYGAEADGSEFWLHTARGQQIGAEDLGGNSPRALYWDDGPIKAYIPGRSRFRRPRGARESRSAARPRPQRSREPATWRIVKYKGPQLGEIEGRIVGLADILGDWREEVITAVDGELRIYTTTIPATSRRVALMQDRVYRMDTALQAMAYFYPPQLGGKLFDGGGGPTANDQSRR